MNIIHMCLNSVNTIATQILVAMDSTFANKVLNEIISWCAAIAAIILVVFLVKDIIGLIKGSTSLASVLLKVAAAFVIIGIMLAAGSFEQFGGIFKDFFTDNVTSQNLPSFD